MKYIRLASMLPAVETKFKKKSYRALLLNRARRIHTLLCAFTVARPGTYLDLKGLVEHQVTFDLTDKERSDEKVVASS